MMYQICWRSLITGATGKGTAGFPKEQAQSIADELNKEEKKHDILIHWIEPMKQAESDKVETKEE